MIAPQTSRETDYRWLMLAVMAVLTVGLLCLVWRLGIQLEASKELLGKCPKVVETLKDPCTYYGPTQCRCCACSKEGKK